MEIYIVKNEKDTVNSIAERYGVTVQKLIQDNGLDYPYNLVIGQAIVITFPKQSHIVQQGDTLQSIAESYNVSLSQLLRNNSYLLDREFIYQGETLTISYSTKKSIAVNGFAYPFIKREILIKTLPNLSYLSIFNYSITEGGKIIEYQDDLEIIKVAKDYGVIPLMMLTTLTPQGESNIELAYRILTNDECQNRNIDEFVSIIKTKGFLGINLVFNFLTSSNQFLYQNFAQKISNRLKEEGLLFFVTINYKSVLSDDINSITPIDYAKLSTYVNDMLFLKFDWGTNYGPPAPVSNIKEISAMIDNVATSVSSDKISIGKPTIGYDWLLPYIPNKTYAVSLTINYCLNISYDAGAIILLDEDSQTPYFYYNQFTIGYPFQHIVWFIDARSIDALNKLIIENNLKGSGIWNIMVYNAQIWTVINATFDIVK